MGARPVHQLQHNQNKRRHTAESRQQQRPEHVHPLRLRAHLTHPKGSHRRRDGRDTGIDCSGNARLLARAFNPKRLDNAVCGKHQVEDERDRADRHHPPSRVPTHAHDRRDDKDDRCHEQQDAVVFVKKTHAWGRGSGVPRRIGRGLSTAAEPLLRGESCGEAVVGSRR